jgi:hypothetical protein
MSATTGEQTAIERYLEAVRAELADLPDDERVDMLEDVEQHLLEVAAEGDEPLETRLGPPAEYAAELRAAAGLPRRADEDNRLAARFATRISRSRTVRSVTRAYANVQRSAWYGETVRFVRSLQPAWWLTRAYIVTMLLGEMTTEHGWWTTWVPRVGGSAIFGLLLLITLTAASVAWARVARANRLLLVITVAANVFLVVSALNFLQAQLTKQQFTYAQAPQRDATPVSGPLGDVRNIYPYAADGTPLKDVLLYDQDGRPIQWAVTVLYYPGGKQVVTGPDGTRPPNMFPYSDPIRDEQTGAIVAERQPPRIIPPSPIPAATSAAVTELSPSSAAVTELSPSSASASPSAVLPPSSPLTSPSASLSTSPSTATSPSPSPSASAPRLLSPSAPPPK